MRDSLPKARFMSPALLVTLLLALSYAVPCKSETAWHHPLYLGRGGLWQERIPITIHNAGTTEIAGRPVTIEIGDQADQAQLAGARVDALRIVNGTGIEVLYSVVGPNLEPVDRGPIPPGSTLTIPAECGPGESVTYYAYYANPKAWAVPDFLKIGTPGTLNGGFEKGSSGQPLGWGQKDNDAEHQNSWVTETPHSGTHCVRTTVVPGSAANWVAYCKRGMSVIPGADYSITAWVKGKEIKGRSGWFLHVATESGGSMGIHRLPDAGDGTFDWCQVKMEFTAPQDALSMTVGTVLHGTGIAWFDDIEIHCNDRDKVTATAGAPEKLSLRIVRGKGWHAPTDEGWTERTELALTNTTDNKLKEVLGYVDLGAVLHGAVDSNNIRVMDGAEDLDTCVLDGKLLFRISVPKQSIKIVHMYRRQQVLPRPQAASPRGASRLGSDIPSDQVFVSDTPQTDIKAYAALMTSEANLAKNPSFESGDSLPTDWPGAAEKQEAGAVTYGLSKPGAFGQQCAEFSVPHDSRKDWIGWRQDIPVTPGRTYMFASWLRCSDIRNGTVKLHAHLRTADGSLCSTSPFLSAGKDASRTTDWFPCVGFAEIPADGQCIQVHLTMNATGALAHDGVLVTEAIKANAASLESRMVGKDKGLAVWSVNPIIKVFHETIPPPAAPDLKVMLARNESEPLQLAVRSRKAITGLDVVVSPAKDDQGQTLGTPDITIVGYVPIDHKTSYYRSESPVWHRKYPTRGGSCDGWAGWWPDPLLPQKKMSLKAGETQAVWLTFSTKTNTPPGTYRTTVQLKQKQKILFSASVTITVWDFALPEQNHIAAIYDVRAGSKWAEEGKSNDEVRHDIMRMMASRRLCADRVRSAPRFKRDGDTITADFTAYDKEARFYFDELAFTRSYMPGFFYLFGWAHPPKKILGEPPYEGEYPYEDADRTQLRPEYKRVYQECLRQYWNHVKEMGWADRLILYISDEPHFTHEHIRDQMRALCDMIHEVDPDIPIYSSTWRHCPEWDGYLNVWGVGQYGCFPVEEMQTRAKAGDRLWFTTDGQMCTDTPYCAIERLLPHYCFKYNVEAYEFWGVDWLTYDPFEFGWHAYIHQSSTPGKYYYVRYPNGDGFLLYPGKNIGLSGPVSSVRFEQAREGVEDYEYLHKLRNLADATGDKTAKELLEEATTLVDIPNAGGRYSSKILPDPDVIPRLRERIATEILRLEK